MKFLFLVYVNQSLGCIRRCRTDLVSIVFPVFFARFLVICCTLSYFFGSFSVRVSLILYFPFFFFAVIVLVNREVKSRIQTVRECSLHPPLCKRALTLCKSPDFNISFFTVALMQCSKLLLARFNHVHGHVHKKVVDSQRWISMSPLTSLYNLF